MCKVLIVDDEVYICKLIENLIDWDQLGMWIVGIANDGLMAYQMIQDKQPDIVISDIRMAGYDGIDLIRHVRENGQHTHFIFISGYRQFEYAQSAMKYGAADYLLKPINKEELNTVLIRIQKQIAEDSIYQLEKEKIREIQRMNEKLTGKQLIDYLNRREDADELLLKRDYGLVMEECKARFAVIKLFTESEGAEHRQIEFVIRKTIQSLETECQVLKNNCTIAKMEDDIVALFVYRNSQADEAREIIQSLWRRLKNLTREYGNYCVLVGCGPEADTTQQLQQSFRIARQASNMRFMRNADSQIELDKMLPKELSFQETFPQGMREISTALLSFNAEVVWQVIERRFDAIRENKKAIPENFSEGIDMIVHCIREQYSNVKKEQLEELCTIPRRKGSYLQMKQAVKEIVSKIMKDSYEEKRYQEEQPIRIAKKYIEENYAENVCLEEVAELACLNANYFSALFKKITGKNFSEYLTDWRMEEAKKLLRTTTKNMSQICLAVGYKDAKYFSKLFTKTVGLKPNEYRKLYS